MSIVDKMGKIGTSAPLTYYASCKAFPKAPVCRLYSFGIHRHFERAETKEEKWGTFLTKRPQYYITLKTANLANMANDNGILELVQKSGLFEEVPSPECPYLVIYRYKGELINSRLFL